MMIDDEELRSVFKTASDEHLQNLDDGLLHLEKHPDDQAMLAALMREAHSLKGDANMLGVKDVGTLAHQVEHVLNQLKHREITLSLDVSDRLAHALNAIRRLVDEAVTGVVAGVDTFHVLAELMGSHPVEANSSQTNLIQSNPVQSNAVPANPVELSSEQSALMPTKALESQESLDLGPENCRNNEQHKDGDNVGNEQNRKEEEKIESRRTETDEDKQWAVETNEVDTYWKRETVELPVVNEPRQARDYEPVESQLLPHTIQSPTNNYRIETIRVGTRNLDTLMTEAGELTVTKIRIAHRLSEIETIANLWEEWSRDLFVHRFEFDQVQRSNSALHRFKAFHSRSEQRLEQLGSLVKNLYNSLADDTARLEQLSGDLEEGIRRLRLLPLSTLFNIFPRMVRDLARQEEKLVEFVIEGGETHADKRLIEEIKDPLLHILRNAIDHGIELPDERKRLGKSETAVIRLRAYQTPTHIVIEISDDGRGLDLDAIKQTALKRGMYQDDELAAMPPSQIQALIFHPGFSTAPLVTEVSGRGVGLDVVRTNVEKLKGTIDVESTPGQGCTLRIQLGITLATAHVLIVSVHGMPYAIPVEFVQMACLVLPSEILTLGGRNAIIQHNQPIFVAKLADLLELSAAVSHSITDSMQQSLFCIILKVGQEQLGLFVDGLMDEQDVMIKPQSQLLKRVRNVSGATILGTGEVCMVLEPHDLIKSARCSSGAIVPQASQSTSPKQTVLLVEDSIATRTQEKRILETAGYQVITAVDGMDGFNKLQANAVDAVVTDVQMPNLDGLELTAKIRQHRRYNELPIILVTSLASDEDKRRGAEAGANAYLTKGSFNQDLLLATLQRLIYFRILKLIL